MNKVYKIIWSEAQHAYVVVSELAKNHCRASKSSAAKITAVAACLGVFTGSLGILPAYAAKTETASTQYTVVTGQVKTVNDDHDNPSATPTITKADMAIGKNSVAKGDKSTAIGDNSDVDGDYSIAIGDTSKVVNGSSSVAVGNHSTATGSGSTVIGAQSSGVAGSTVIGMSSSATKINSVAVGYLSKVSTAGGIAIGIAAQNLEETGIGQDKPGVAIGHWSKANGQSIAVGSMTNALGSYSIAIGDSSSTAEGAIYASLYGRGSTIGTDSKKATLIGAYAKIGDRSKFSTAIGANSEVVDNISYATVVGYNSYAYNNAYSGTTLGANSEVSADSGVAIGSYSVASTESGAYGYDIITGTNSTDNSKVWRATSGAVSVGGIATVDSGTMEVTRQITNVAAGTQDTDAVNVAQLKQVKELIDNAGGNDTHVKAGEYTVTDNKVSMDIVDKDGNTTGTVTINDVASKTELNEVSNRVTTIENKIDNIQGDITNISKKATTVIAGTNTTVEDGTNENGGKEFKVSLKPDVTLGDADTDGSLTVVGKDGSKVEIKNGVVNANGTSISKDGLKVGDKTYVSKDGLNANDQKITNVADGEISATSKDAVNGSQLHATNQQINNINNNLNNMDGRINKLNTRVNKVGAGAAALAALHPLDFDPDEKLSFAAGVGNYAGENAAALGAFYRPTEKVMFSLGGTVGNGENMVNAGITFALDRTSNISHSRTALAREVLDLRAQLAEVNAQMAKMQAAFGVLDENKTKLFPDIPANHWAYEYIAKLAGNGIIEGYPDGNFGGNRLMTRYEFAAMLYRAIEKGAALEERIINEFAPELGRIRVDRISGKDNDKNKVERIRVNYGSAKDKRDHYGSKIVTTTK